MGFISAFSYISTVSQILSSIGMYRMHKDESILAGELAQIVLGALPSKMIPGIARDKLAKAIASVVDVIEGKI